MNVARTACLSVLECTRANRKKRKSRLQKGGRQGGGAHQVIQDGEGEIQHAHLDRLSESSVQVEQRLGFHLSDRSPLTATRGITGKKKK